MSETDRRGLGEEWRPRCCPEPRCVPVHTLSGSEKPLSQAVPGETFVCFGAAPTVEFVYDGARHVNDTRSCTYTPLKGVISYQENADDWRALSNAYHLAVSALLAFRDGDEGARNRPTRVTYVLSKTYSVLAHDEDEAEGIALGRTPKALSEAEADVTSVG